MDVAPHPGSPEFNASGISGGDQFGVSAAAVGDNFIVGADQPFTDAGVVYWLDGATGNLLLTIANPEPATGDHFGNRVAALGGDLSWGGPGRRRSDKLGTVYVFQGAGTGGRRPADDQPHPRSNDRRRHVDRGPGLHGGRRGE